MANTVQALIVRSALKHGLDPAAVLAVANVEGGIHFGEVGDHGTSYGPFQLHVGGALPKGKGAAWANSPAGIDYAVSQMAQHAKGLTGKAAVASIVTNFERPADIPGEIAKAYGGYGQFTKAAAQGGVAPVVAPKGAGGVPAAPNSPQGVDWMQQFKQQAANTILQQSLALAQGGDVNQFTQGLAGLAQGRRQAEAMAAQYPVTLDKHGTVEHPVQLTKGEGPASVKLAAQQIGQPYVWGGESRKEGGFDCSGLIDWTMRQQGYKGPRITTQTAMHMGVSVKKDQIQPGDWIIANNGDHMVMYAGNGKVIAAPHTGTVVQYQPLSHFTNITDIRRVGV